MRNKILSLTRDSIPYVKGLRTLPLVKSASAAILMQQLDYWFAKYPDGFYKFLQPCLKHPAYKEGDSWAEELAFSCGEFRTAFDSIGVRYMSKKAYDEAEHKFETMSEDSDIVVKYYCSYHDKQKGVTWYFRNHDFVDSSLDTFLSVKDVKGDRTKPFPVNGDSQSTQMGIPNLQNLGFPIYTDGDSQSTLYTEITPEITPETTHTRGGCADKKSLEAEQISVEPTKPNQSFSNQQTDIIPDTSPAAPNSPPKEKYVHSTQKCDNLFKPSKLPPWRNSEKRNDFDKGFIDYLANTYLPATPHYQKHSLPLEKGCAFDWINEREHKEPGLSKLETRFEVYQTSLKPVEKKVSRKEAPNEHIWRKSAYQMTEEEHRTLLGQRASLGKDGFLDLHRFAEAYLEDVRRENPDLYKEYVKDDCTSA